MCAQRREFWREIRTFEPLCLAAAKSVVARGYGASGVRAQRDPLLGERERERERERELLPNAKTKSC